MLSRLMATPCTKLICNMLGLRFSFLCFLFFLLSCLSPPTLPQFVCLLPSTDLFPQNMKTSLRDETNTKPANRARISSIRLFNCLDFSFPYFYSNSPITLSGSVLLCFNLSFPFPTQRPGGAELAHKHAASTLRCNTHGNFPRLGKFKRMTLEN